MTTPAAITAPAELHTWIGKGAEYPWGHRVDLVTEIAIPGSWDDLDEVRAAQEQVNALTIRAGTLLRHSTQDGYTPAESEIVRDRATGIARYAEQISAALHVLYNRHEELVPGRP